MLADLCRHLDIAKLTAVIGQSAGGPTALALAARHPDLVERLILQSAVGLLPWLDRRTRLAGAIAFHPRTQAATWTLIRTLAHRAPRLALRLLLSDLTSRPVTDLLPGLPTASRTALLELFGRMRSGTGFSNDMRIAKVATRSPVSGSSWSMNHLPETSLLPGQDTPPLNPLRDTP